MQWIERCALPVRAAAHRVYVTVSAGNRAPNRFRAQATCRQIQKQAYSPSSTPTGSTVSTSISSQQVVTDHVARVHELRLLHRRCHASRGTSRRGRPRAVYDYPWDAERYGDVAAANAHVVVMAYDHEFDVACAPISPYSWLEQVVSYAQSQVPAGSLTIGIPSYGYTTTSCRRVAHVTSNVAYVTMEGEPGFPLTPAGISTPTATRVPERSAGRRETSSTTSSMPQLSMQSSTSWRRWESTTSRCGVWGASHGSAGIRGSEECPPCSSFIQ